MALKNILLLMGGQSTEHAISLRSGRSIFDALDKSKYNVTIVGISKEGIWNMMENNDFLTNAEDAKLIALKDVNNRVFLDVKGKSTFIMRYKGNKRLMKVDAVFSAIHGAYGEDGVLQGYLRSVNLPFVGVDLLASAVGMDKDFSKRLWRDAGIPIADFEVITQSNKTKFKYSTLAKRLGTTMFVKPANAGSSVGVHKVTNESEFKFAVKDAFQYDRKLLIEEAVIGIEVECAVLGNENVKASVIGGIVPTDKFYSYDAKYISSTGAKLMIPAPIDEKISETLRTTAIKAFKCIGGEGLSRVDFFLRDDNSFVLNEINTLPGFTSISMYPKLWEASGLAYTDLLDELIRLAIDRYKQLNKLKTTI
jgi:D-alanine-D-alanine ligase